LLSTEEVLKFLFKVLEESNSDLRHQLLKAVKEEISKRRDKTLVSLIRLLHNPNNISQKESDVFFNISARNDIYKFAKTISSRIFGTKNLDYSENREGEITQITHESETEIMEEIEREETLKKQLNHRSWKV